MADRGQTETLGFVLVFAIITASIGLVFATGFTGLDDARAVEQVNNAERAFEVYSENIDDITQRNAPNRATEIKLADATLTLAEPIEVSVNVVGDPLNETYAIRPLVYDAQTGEQLIYVQGAILRKASGRAVVLQESTMVLDANRTVLPIIQTRRDGTGSIGGSTTVLIRATHAQSSFILVDNAPPTIWFNVSTPHAAAWASHLEDASGVSSCSVIGDTAACQIDTDRAVITLVQIDVDLD